MKRWKTWRIALFIIACVLLNLGGRELADTLQLPLWLDAYGTVLCAYAGGPVCGAMVGLTSNLAYGMIRHVSWIYGLTSVALGILVGFSAKEHMLDSKFGAMSIAAVAALVAIAISVPMNILFYGGSTGNLWGDGVIGFLREQRCPQILAEVIGQFYVDFLDKLLTLMALHLTVWLVRRVRAGRGDHGAAANRALLLACALLALGAVAPQASARAAEAVEYNDYVQSVYSSNNGLPCGEANDIAQTSDGLLWIGTYAGLYRYNGKEFRWMDYSSVRNVNCLYVDDEGRLWIGTNDNGLSIVIHEQVSNVVDQSVGLPTNSVRSILQSSDGYYYIGTTGSMQVLTLNNGLRRVNTLWEVHNADSIAADDSGHVAAVTSDGRLFLMEKGRILSSLQLTYGGEIFQCCTFDAQGRLLVGTSENHLYTYEISGGSFRQLRERAIAGISSLKNLTFTEGGEMFVTAHNGVAYMDGSGNFRIINTNEFNTSIDNMLIDYQGNLWFTSSRLGLLRMAPSAFKDAYTSAGLKRKVVNAVAQWGGSYYFGTDNGLDAVTPDCLSSVKNELIESLEGVRIRCLLTDSSGSLWICAYGAGLIEVEPDGTRHVYDETNNAFGNRARIVVELSDGTILAGGNTGLSYIRDHQVIRTVREQDGLLNTIILSITELNDGRVLVGTDGGGIALLEDGQVTRTFTAEDGLSSGVILRTERDPKSDGVFIVTSNGLCYMAPGGSIRALENFPYFNNYYIWPRDADTLFVMSSAGIYVVDRDDVVADVAGMNFDLLDARMGLNGALTANSFCCFDGADNLFLPCDRGVFVLDIRRYTSMVNRYYISLENVRLDGRPQSMESGRPIEVERGVARIELVPEILNYTIQDPSVGFRLEGFDADWTIMPQSALNMIVYTNLPSGEYNLRLAVFDNSLTKILAERDFPITKGRAIYDYRWFAIYLLLVPMLAVTWVTQLLMRSRMQRALVRQEHELQMARQQIQMGNETVIAIAKAVDAKDERTSQHSQRVSEYSVLIARELGFNEQECENLRRAALLHDIGKIGIPDSILNKPARLTDEEYAVMKSHVVRGAEILKDFTLIDHVVEGALHHHERYDGRGYPSGMAGEEIPIYGRIIGVADAFDAMTANRVYRRQMDFGYVLNEMRNGRGTQFDPEIVDILLKLIDEGKIDLATLYPAPAQEDKPAGGNT